MADNETGCYFIGSYILTVPKHLDIREARSEHSSRRALDSSTYTSILWDPYLHQRIFVTALPVLIGSPNGQKAVISGPQYCPVFRTTRKEDLQATTAEMIYGAPITLPGEFLCSSKQNADPATFMGRLRESMQRLSTPTTRHQGQNTIFVSKDLTTCSHIFLWTDSMRKGLQPPYEDPYKIVNHTEMVLGS
ncbi:retrovirus-related Pol polyprotein from transposon 412 [Nephila pilipes]|uniref:Retrovirus-related Pol polyprotein from transposon 412 n=1 Tax=Nephila pilipes TaxID=299642 RepID=A0A8X6UPX3_NEPPI|nr:retrovirus-related Pol polyprotein from transposon 412 [Nephila pilipes]